MRALIVGEDQLLSTEVQAILKHNGIECEPTDVIRYELAPIAATRAVYELIILLVSNEAPRAVTCLNSIRDAANGHILVVGPATDPKFILRVLQAGADAFLDEDELQEELDRFLVRQKVQQRNTIGGAMIGILGASGGSGSSMLAANLAVVLAHKYERTALVDLRLTAGDLAFLFDLKPAFTIADLSRNFERADRSMFSQTLVRHESGVYLLAAPNDLMAADDVTTQCVNQALSLAQSAFPYTIVDLDRTVDSKQLAAIVRCDLILLVLRLDMTSLRNTRRIMDHLAYLNVNKDRVQIVVNRYHQPKQLSWRKAEQSLETQILHYIPNDPARINAADNSGVPVVLHCPRTRISQSIVGLAARLPHLVNPHLSNGKVKKSVPGTARVNSAFSF